LGVPYPFDLQPIYFFAINIFFPEFQEDINSQKESPCQLMQKWYHPILIPRLLQIIALKQ
jgi:hypothetical protein